MVEQQSSYFKNIKQEKKRMAERDQEFVEYIVKQIVNHPEDVTTERTVDEMGVLITLKVHPEDMGYVIGKQGQTARSIRTLLKIVGAKEKARVNLKIYEPEGSRMNRRDSAPSSSDVVDTDVEDLKI